jgi:hypothetical protein
LCSPLAQLVLLTRCSYYLCLLLLGIAVSKGRQVRCIHDPPAVDYLKPLLAASAAAAAASTCLQVATAAKGLTLTFTLTSHNFFNVTLRFFGDLE